jgi:hypothetical protein
MFAVSGVDSELLVLPALHRQPRQGTGDVEVSHRLVDGVGPFLDGILTYQGKCALRPIELPCGLGPGEQVQDGDVDVSEGGVVAFDKEVLVVLHELLVGLGIPLEIWEAVLRL